MSYVEKVKAYIPGQDGATPNSGSVLAVDPDSTAGGYTRKVLVVNAVDISNYEGGSTEGTVSLDQYDQQTKLLLCAAAAGLGQDISTDDGIIWTFSDTDGVTINNGEITGGVLKNTTTAATAGGDLVPTMSDYTNGSWTIIASSENSPSSYPAWNVCNGNAVGLDNSWSPASTSFDSNGDGNAYVDIVNTEEQTIAAVKIAMGHTILAATDFTVQCTSDDVNWEPILTVTGADWADTANTWITYPLDVSQASGKRFRLDITKVDTTAGYCYVSGFQLVEVGAAATVNQLDAIIDPVELPTTHVAGTLSIVAKRNDATGALTIGDSDSDLTIRVSSDGSTNYSNALPQDSVIDLGNNYFGISVAEFEMTTGTSIGLSISSNQSTGGTYIDGEITGAIYMGRTS